MSKNQLLILTHCIESNNYIECTWDMYSEGKDIHSNIPNRHQIMDSKKQSSAYAI